MLDDVDRPRWRTRIAGALPVLLVLLVGANLSSPFLQRASAGNRFPPADQFANSAISVMSGSHVNLHWTTPRMTTASPTEFFVLTSSGAALPNRGKAALLTWAAGSDGAWDETRNSWRTTSRDITITVPAGIAVGSTLVISVVTCDSRSGECSNSRGAPPPGQGSIALTVIGGWTTVPYQAGFSVAQKYPTPAGDPLDVAFSADGSLWGTSEFSDSLSEVAPGSQSLVGYTNPTNAVRRPFAYCFSSPCRSSAVSALSERIVSEGGNLWFTRGGWFLGYRGNGNAANHSEVVSFNMQSKTFCTYLVPGNDNAVIGLAVAGPESSPTIWFVEFRGDHRHPTLDRFDPSTIQDGCPGRSNEVYQLPPSVRILRWPTNGSPGLGRLGPAQITFDSSAAALWVTDYFGSEVDRIDLPSMRMTRYTLPVRNTSALAGSEPWQLALDANYVYVAEYGNSDIVRINKFSGASDRIPIPLASDTEQAYGLAIADGRLYFTLSDDARPATGAESALGYLDLAATEQHATGCPLAQDRCVTTTPTGVIYAGLQTYADPNGPADFRGIVTNAQGGLGLADFRQLLLLTP